MAQAAAIAAARRWRDSLRLRDASHEQDGPDPQIADQDHERVIDPESGRGMRNKVSSVDNATVGSGTGLNDVQFSYTNFAVLSRDYQAHGGAVNTSTSPSVQYAYANGSANTIRPTRLTYPDSRQLNFNYGATNGMGDAASRVAALIDDDSTTHLADYSYLGAGTFVLQDDTEPDIEWTLIDIAGSNDPDTGDIYSGFDRFGRIKDNRWYDYGGSADVDRVKYGYDRAGNRIWRENPVATALSASFDELYTNDGVQRLKDMQRGTLNGGHTTLTTRTFAQCWSLDPTGNWQGFLEEATEAADPSGRKKAEGGRMDTVGTWDLNQARTANTVNEITDITNSVGSAWIDPASNRAGNMTTMPQPGDPTSSYTATYDAWNRLVKLVDPASSDTVSEYAYDGVKRRIVQKSYTGGTLSETRHLYYTQPSQWQVVEERLGTSPDSADAERQHVWGLRYIDDCLLRDRDTDGNGTLDERLYALQDANWNVTSLTDASGTIQERYSYTPYGVPLYLDASFTPQGSSNYDWTILYCGYRYEAATGLYHVRHRVLHPVLGTWVQRDPLGLAAAVSLYEYVHSVPLSHVDAIGLQPQGKSCEDEYDKCIMRATTRLGICFGIVLLLLLNCIKEKSLFCKVACWLGPLSPVCTSCLSAAVAWCGLDSAIQTAGCLIIYNSLVKDCQKRYTKCVKERENEIIPPPPGLVCDRGIGPPSAWPTAIRMRQSTVRM